MSIIQLKVHCKKLQKLCGKAGHFIDIPMIGWDGIMIVISLSSSETFQSCDLLCLSIFIVGMHVGGSAFNKLYVFMENK